MINIASAKLEPSGCKCVNAHLKSVIDVHCYKGPCLSFFAQEWILTTEIA